MKRHRHEQSMWIIAGGYWFWCYQCGAIRLNPSKSGDPTKWQRPTGIGGENPAMQTQPLRNATRHRRAG